MNKDKMSKLPAIQPISNRNLDHTSSGYGIRIHPILKIKKFHHGMDFVGKFGTKIYTTGDGVVSVVNENFSGYGKYIKINHGFGYETAYAHLSKLLVKKNQKIKRGEPIGELGNTGLSTGPHLHYEVLFFGKTKNPINYFYNDLSARDYQNIINISNGFDKSMD